MSDHRSYAASNWISTWMGDNLRICDVIRLFLFMCGGGGIFVFYFLEHSQAFAAIYFVDKKYVVRKIEMIA